MFEKILERLEALTHDNPMVTSNYILRKDAIQIVQEVAKEHTCENCMHEFCRADLHPCSECKVQYDDNFCPKPAPYKKGE